MQEKVFQPGVEIIKIGDPCDSIIFVVNGTIEIEIIDLEHNKYEVDLLK